MEAVKSLFKETSTFNIYVKTSDRYGAGTNASVFIVLIDANGKRSETRKLNNFFRNDFERNCLNDFTIKIEQQLDEIRDLEIWRNSSGTGAQWHLEYLTVENAKTKAKVVFPFHRWVECDVHHFIEAYDCSLPQECRYTEQRATEMKERKGLYQYKEAFPNLPLQVASIPEDDEFCDKYLWDMTKFMLSLHAERLVAGAVHIDRKANFKSIEEFVTIFDNFKSLDIPMDVKNWKEDTYFGKRRLNGCNPKLIALCTEIPTGFAVDKIAVKPFLEGKTVEEAIQKKKLFIIDLTVMDGITTLDDFVMTSPYCLLYLRDNSELVPIAIQLFKEPGEKNPVFYPSDEENLWLFVKMWFCLSDSTYHQSASHLGATHLMMEGFCVSMNKTMSLSHPVHKLLAPHFMFLIAINDRALRKLVSPGGWIDQSKNTGRIGLLEIVGKAFADYDIIGHGDFLGDLKRRGIDDENVLPNFYYRDDGKLVYDAIKKYTTDMVKAIYKTEQDILDDTEIQAWHKVITTPKPNGLGHTSVPGGDKFSTHDDISTLLTYIIFNCSVEHAAVNFSQYDNYAFTPAYPAKMSGTPPTDKSPVTMEAILSTLGDKDHMMKSIVMTTVLSERGTQALGNFEVDYIFRPDLVAIVEKFRADLKKASDIITERDTNRDIPYSILNPAHIPNSISI